jgi:hypothetical protein
MKSDILKFEENQIYLLENGEYVLLMDVMPATKIHQYENERTCECKVGHNHIKNEEFNSNKKLLILNNSDVNSTITFDMGTNVRMTLSQLRGRAVSYIGKLSDSGIEKMRRI